MRAIDRRQYHSKSLNHLELLKKADPLRNGYYTDLSNKWSIEEKLEEWISLNSYYVPLNLSNLNLVALHYLEYICVADELLLQNNNLNLTRNEDKLLALKLANVNISAMDI